MVKRGSISKDAIGRWSEDKLRLLEKYLKAYAKIMNGQKQTWLESYHYIDAFAGSGKPKAKDEERYVAGSPLRALQCDPPFDYYSFIELSSWRVAQLQQLKMRFPLLKIDILEGDCNELLSKKIVPKITYASKQRGLVFLDPYGLQVEWETVKALAKANTFDVFVNFPLGAVTRLLKRDEPPTGQTADLLNKVLGSTDWIQAIYRPSPQLPLFGEPIVVRDVMRAEWLARLYSDQIGKLFPYVSKPVIMTNSKKSPLYALFLVSHNKTGVKIVNDVFGSFERLRELGR
jgi:three-Cys-motif partner protein